MRRYLAPAVAALISACSSTPSDLVQKTPPVLKSYDLNYQEIYRRVANGAKRCWAGVVDGGSEFVVDSELYSELGFGELTFSMSSLGVRNYYWSAKIERVGAGSQMTLHAGNSLTSSNWTNAALRWADGDESC